MMLMSVFIAIPLFVIVMNLGIWIRLHNWRNANAHKKASQAISAAQYRTRGRFIRLAVAGIKGVSQLLRQLSRATGVS